MSPANARGHDGEGTRARVLRIVQERPGIHKSELCRLLDIGWGTVSYHLRVLEQERQVKTRTRGRLVHVFPGGLDDRTVDQLSAVTGIGPRLLRSLGGGRGRRVVDLTRDLGQSRKLIQRHLTTLGDEGIVRRMDGAQPRYTIDDAIQNELEDLLALLPDDGFA